MKMIQRSAAVLLVFGATILSVSASDPTGVYARVDKVVLAPSQDAPDTIQVWGVFSMAMADNPNDYLPPAKGYLYFRLPANAEVARKEWNDLKAVAGTGQIVSFGKRWDMKARIRRADETPAAPDAYTLNVGVTKVRANMQYAPVRALVDFKD